MQRLGSATRTQLVLVLIWSHHGPFDGRQAAVLMENSKTGQMRVTLFDLGQAGRAF